MTNAGSHEVELVFLILALPTVACVLMGLVATHSQPVRAGVTCTSFFVHVDMRPTHFPVTRARCTLHLSRLPSAPHCCPSVECRGADTEWSSSTAYAVRTPYTTDHNGCKCNNKNKDKVAAGSCCFFKGALSPFAGSSHTRVHFRTHTANSRCSCKCVMCVPTTQTVHWAIHHFASRCSHPPCLLSVPSVAQRLPQQQQQPPSQLLVQTAVAASGRRARCSSPTMATMLTQLTALWLRAARR